MLFKIYQKLNSRNLLSYYWGTLDVQKLFYHEVVETNSKHHRTQNQTRKARVMGEPQTKLRDCVY